MSRQLKALRPTANMTDEERLLLANRERLLARSDWLGLAASRPARIRFPTSSDRDRVAKRRKIDKSKSKFHKAKPARRRSISPLHEHRLPPFEPMMSGAVVDEDIQVKVGTDAFVSQSQYSHPAQTTINTSMRHPSSEFGPLSEESMLLGADDDGFEIDANGQYLGALGQVGGLAGGSGYLRAPSNLHSTDDFTIATNSIAPTFATTSQGNDLHDENYEANNVEEQPPQEPVEDSRGYRPNESFGHLTEPTVVYAETWDHPQAGDEQHATSTEADSEEGERRWRRAMRIPEATSTGNSSLAALRSSSQHVAQSTTSAWPVQLVNEESDRDKQRRHGIHPTGLPKSHAPKADDHPNTNPAIDGARNSNPAIATLMPPLAVSKQTVDKVSEPQSFARDDETLWRDFILGKHRSDSDASDREHRVWALEQDEAVQRAFQSTSSKVGTEQVRSDRVTVGDFASVVEELSDDEPNGPRQSNSEGHPGHTTTSMVGQATTPNFEEDEIDDVYPDDSVSRALGNIHVTQTASTLNPRRFRRSRRQGSTPKANNPHRFKVRSTERSVW